MQLDTSKSNTLDAITAGYIARLPESEGRRMLTYTLGLHRMWRSVLSRLPIESHATILDVGTGYGILPFEIAANLDVDVVASDIMAEYIASCNELAQILRSMGHTRPGARLCFEQADIINLPNPDQHFDLVTVREVFSYLSDPAKAAAELRRVTKAGGTIVVEDIDDHLYLTYPPASPAMATLHRAVDQLQSLGGGDREAGRKLSTYLEGAGLTISSVEVIPEALHTTADPTQGEKAFIVQQIAGVRDRIIAAGILSPEEFDRNIAELASEPPISQFRMNGRVIVFATAP